jgi:hypothetical protein
MVDGIAVLLRAAIGEYAALVEIGGERRPLPALVDPTSARLPRSPRRRGQVGRAVLDLLVRERRPLSTSAIQAMLATTDIFRGISRSSVARAIDWALRHHTVVRAGANHEGALYSTP